MVALGIAKAAMGVPIFIVAIWLTYLVLREGGEIGHHDPTRSRQQSRLASASPVAVEALGDPQLEGPRRLAREAR